MSIMSPHVSPSPPHNVSAERGLVAPSGQVHTNQMIDHHSAEAITAEFLESERLGQLILDADCEPEHSVRLEVEIHRTSVEKRFSVRNGEIMFSESLVSVKGW